MANPQTENTEHVPTVPMYCMTKQDKGKELGTLHLVLQFPMKREKGNEVDTTVKFHVLKPIRPSNRKMNCDLQQETKNHSKVFNTGKLCLMSRMYSLNNAL